MKRIKEIPERFHWAVDYMNIGSADHILEIGCGAGLLAELIAERLQTGSITAIDRSASMIELATNRNQRFAESKVLRLEINAFLEMKNQQKHDREGRY